MILKFTKSLISLLITLFLLSGIVYADEKAGSFNFLNVINPFEIKNNLYQQILDEMNSEYLHIGQREANRVLLNNSTSITGGLNSIGISYQRPFVDFSISADRSLAPDLFDNKRWIVTDKFSIYIDASKVLSKLKDQKIIDISKSNLAAFGGIVFKRSYTWIHYANSYSEGLTLHFEKLFLPFTSLQFKNLLSMNTNEMIFKEDSLSVKAGGLVSAPLYPGLNGQAGVLAKFEKLSKVEVVSSASTTGIGDDIQISYEKSKMTMAGVSLGVQADFLKILKMTLLSYDFSYELASSYKMYLNFQQNNLAKMQKTNPVVLEINELLKNREGDLDVLAPYIISEEKKISQSIKHKYNFLLLGGMKSSRTQQIQVTTGGVVKNFFRHNYEKIKYTEDIGSRIFASAIYAITHSEASAAKLASDTKKVTIEYDSERNLLENHESISIKGQEQKLSMNFSAEFMTKKTIGIFGKKYRDRAAFYLERYSGFDPSAVKMLQSDMIVAPLTISGQYQVNTEGIRYLNSLNMGQVFNYLDGLCSDFPKTEFFNFRNLFDHCRRSLQNDYTDYFKDLSHTQITADGIFACKKKSRWNGYTPSKTNAFMKSCLSEFSYKDKSDWTDIPLWPLKILANNIVNKSNSKTHFYNLFGVQNVFFFGHLDAYTKEGFNFTSSFHEGAFKGLGAVDYFMRLENLRAPASVVVEPY